MRLRASWSLSVAHTFLVALAIGAPIYLIPLCETFRGIASVLTYASNRHQHRHATNNVRPGRCALVWRYNDAWYDYCRHSGQWRHDYPSTSKRLLHRNTVFVDFPQHLHALQNGYKNDCETLCANALIYRVSRRTICKSMRHLFWRPSGHCQSSFASLSSAWPRRRSFARCPPRSNCLACRDG